MFKMLWPPNGTTCSIQIRRGMRGGCTENDDMEEPQLLQGSGNDEREDIEDDGCEEWGVVKV